MTTFVAEAPEVPDIPVLLAVVAEDTATALLYRTVTGFVLETVVWPPMWDTRSRFARALSLDEVRAWIAAHGVMEVDL